jgi:hypothetical protein
VIHGRNDGKRAHFVDGFLSHRGGDWASQKEGGEGNKETLGEHLAVVEVEGAERDAMERSRSSRVF